MKVSIGTANILLTAAVAAAMALALNRQARENRSLRTELSAIKAQSVQMPKTVNGDVTLSSASRLQWEDSPGVAGIMLQRAPDGVVQMNREIRMNGSGTGALFGVKNSEPGANGFATDVPGDRLNRFTIAVSGTMWWGDGTNGQDLELLRNGPSSMEINGSFMLENALTLNGSAPRINNPSGPITISPSGWDINLGGSLRVNNPFNPSGGTTATGTVDVKDVNGKVLHILVHD
jgi:hypothetical protein